MGIERTRCDTPGGNPEDHLLPPADRAFIALTVILAVVVEYALARHVGF